MNIHSPWPWRASRGSKMSAKYPEAHRASWQILPTGHADTAPGESCGWRQYVMWKTLPEGLMWLQSRKSNMNRCLCWCGRCIHGSAASDTIVTNRPAAQSLGHPVCPLEQEMPLLCMWIRHEPHCLFTTPIHVQTYTMVRILWRYCNSLLNTAQFAPGTRDSPPS